MFLFLGLAGYQLGPLSILCMTHHLLRITQVCVSVLRVVLSKRPSKQAPSLNAFHALVCIMFDKVPWANPSHELIPLVEKWTAPLHGQLSPAYRMDANAGSSRNCSLSVCG